MLRNACITQDPLTLKTTDLGKPHEFDMREKNCLQLASHHLFNMSATKYSFEAVIDDEETRDLFKEFLQAEKNVEPLLFIENVEHYLLKKSNANRYEYAARIIEEFIDPSKAIHEINISATTRSDILKSYAECDDGNCPVDLFQVLQNQILLELKIDCFPRFVLSDSFKLFIDKKKLKDEKFVKKLIKVCSAVLWQILLF